MLNVLLWSIFIFFFVGAIGFIKQAIEEIEKCGEPSNHVLRDLAITIIILFTVSIINYFI